MSLLCIVPRPRRHRPYGALQPLPIPEKAWQTVTFDFIVKLPKTARGNDSVCVFVDKLTKMVHFVACREDLTAKDFAELYIDQIWRLHGLSNEFITDRDSRFTSAFWKGVTELIGTKHVMSSSFHPQTDGQTERVNQTLETYLRHFVSAQLNDWDTLLSRAEFAHNAAYHEYAVPSGSPPELASGVMVGQLYAGSWQDNYTRSAFMCGNHEGRRSRAMAQLRKIAVFLLKTTSVFLLDESLRTSFKIPESCFCLRSVSQESWRGRSGQRP